MNIEIKTNKNTKIFQQLQITYKNTHFHINFSFLTILFTLLQISKPYFSSLSFNCFFISKMNQEIPINIDEIIGKLLEVRHHKPGKIVKLEEH